MTGPSLLPFRPAWFVHGALNTKVVNRPAPDLFPAMYLVKKQYTRNETKGRGGFGWREE